MCRSRKRIVISAAHRYIVFLPEPAGRQRIHGKSGLYHGQGIKKDRFVRQKLCTDAHRLRLQRTGHHGITDAEQRPGQKDDDHFDTFYVLQCEAADLRNDNSGLFHSLFSPCHDVGLSAGNCRGNSVRTDHEKNNVQRKSDPLCHGTAGISHSFFAERFAAYVGKGKGFSA